MLFQCLGPGGLHFLFYFFPVSTMRRTAILNSSWNHYCLPHQTVQSPGSVLSVDVREFPGCSHVPGRPWHLRVFLPRMLYDISLHLSSQVPGCSKQRLRAVLQCKVNVILLLVVLKGVSSHRLRSLLESAGLLFFARFPEAGPHLFPFFAFTSPQFSLFLWMNISNSLVFPFGSWP